MGETQFRLKCGHERFGGIHFTMNDKSVLRPFLQVSGPIQQLSAVSVGAKAIYRRDLGLEIDTLRQKF